MLLQESPSAMNTDTNITGKADRIHTSSRMARKLIAIYPSMYHLWFLESQRVPQLRPHLLRHHLHHRSLHQITEIQHQKTEMLKLQYRKGMEVWMSSYFETRCTILQKAKNKTKIGNPKKYKEMYRMTCVIGYRNSGRIWLMKVLPRCVGDTRCRGVQTLLVLLIILQWSRKLMWNQDPVSAVYLRTFRRIRIVKYG